MKISTFGFLTRRGVRNLGKHWAMTIACIASLSVCMTLNIFASLIEVNVDSMVSYLGSQNEMVVYVDPEADDATIQSVGNALSGTAGVSRVQYMSKEDVLNQYKGYMSDYAALLNEFENDNPFKANYRVSLSDLNQMETISKQFENISGVYSVTAPIEMTKTFVEIQQAVTKVGRGLVLVLMAVSIITVGTTIRLSVFARRREIEIMKYVGATNALVTLPFVIEGLTMGLLSGILLDTQDFTLHTGVRTFEAAAALRRYGAETERVRRLFDVTMVEYNAKADLVEKAQMYKNCAISIGGEVAPEARVAIAQAANDLLRIQGVDASFVAVQVGNGVNVSARSMGAVNVQVIMESLGGGGHQTMAAAQLKHITPQAARSRIQDAIDQYYLSQKKTTPEARPAKGE